MPKKLKFVLLSIVLIMMFMIILPGCTDDSYENGVSNKQRKWHKGGIR